MSINDDPEQDVFYLTFDVDLGYSRFEGWTGNAPVVTHDPGLKRDRFCAAIGRLCRDRLQIGPGRHCRARFHADGPLHKLYFVQTE